MKPMKPKSLDPSSLLPDLMHAAHGSTLRTLDPCDLQTLISALEIAVETARVAAINRVLESSLQIDPRPAASTPFDFAILFAALRRARAEGKRREDAATDAARQPRKAG